MTKHLKWTSLMYISLMTTYIYVKFTIMLSVITTSNGLHWRPLMASINTHTHTYTHRQLFFFFSDVNIKTYQSPLQFHCKSHISSHCSNLGPMMIFDSILMEASVIKSSSACASHSPQFKFSSKSVLTNWTCFFIFIQ
jgi:hypothetical protein